MINQVATSVWDCWSNTNNALNKRSSEMMESKNKIQLHLHKIQQEIFDIEKHIELLRKAINDKSNPLKVAQTRLECRSHRSGLEQCRLVFFGCISSGISYQQSFSIFTATMPNFV